MSQFFIEFPSSAVMTGLAAMITGSYCDLTIYRGFGYGAKAFQYGV
jgi:hypothetical protein